MRELDAHHDGRVALDSRRSLTLTIVAAVREEERILGVRLEK
jgi:hypothetical protein